MVFKTALALAAAGIAAMLDGFLEVRLPDWLKAGGALAVFVVVYFWNPASYVVQPGSQEPEPKIPPDPGRDDTEVVVVVPSPVDTPGVDTPIHIDSDTFPSRPPTVNVQVEVTPAASSILLVDGSERGIGTSLPMLPGQHVIDIMNPDYPIWIDTVSISEDRRLPYDLSNHFIDRRELNLVIGSQRDLSARYLEIRLNGRGRRYAASAIPISTLRIPVGLWRLEFDIISPGQLKQPIDSFRTFPYTNGPKRLFIGNKAEIDFSDPEWQDFNRVNIVIW